MSQLDNVSREAKPLGRGLDSLLGSPSGHQGVDKKEGLAMLPISVLRPGNYQPRRDFNPTHMQELVESIRHNGVLQPILVRASGEVDKFNTPLYEIIAGERRWRASQLAGRTTIPVVIRHLTDKQALESGLIENIQRDDLNAMEEAQGYQRLIDEFSYTQETISKMIGKSRSHIANTLRLLNLPKSIQQLLESKKLSAGHARALINCDQAEAFSRLIIRENLSVRQTEMLVAKYHDAPFDPESYVHADPKMEAAQKPRGETKKAKSHTAISEQSNDQDILALESELSEFLGLKCALSMSASQSGQVLITFKNPQELDRLMNFIFGRI